MTDSFHTCMPSPAFAQARTPATATLSRAVSLTLSLISVTSTEANLACTFSSAALSSGVVCTRSNMGVTTGPSCLTDLRLNRLTTSTKMSLHAPGTVFANPARIDLNRFKSASMTFVTSADGGCALNSFKSTPCAAARSPLRNMSVMASTSPSSAPSTSIFLTLPRAAHNLPANCLSLVSAISSARKRKCVSVAPVGRCL
ncbi:hypothetical protein BCR44DRAFT_1440172, partial [Catenaria anguillulae PL171]